MDWEFVKLLQIVRDRAGISMRITRGGGFRCPNYGDNEDSAHKVGKAADVECTSSRNRYKLIHAALTPIITDLEWELVRCYVADTRRTPDMTPEAQTQKIKSCLEHSLKIPVFDRIGIGEDFVHFDSGIVGAKTPDVIWHYYD
jgi:hypothetical protein